MSVSKALYLPARAKLNLVLRIVGQRRDGYHLLESLFHTLDLHDDVAVERVAEGREISVTADHERLLVPANEGNLAMKAVAQLQAELPGSGGFHVRLHKRIPNGGGLGGGSSDAASVLRLANCLLGEPLGLDALARIALRLGADVPFFLRGGTQWGRGVGDELSAAPHVARHFVLIVPPYGCSTVDVYKLYAARWRKDGDAANVGVITVANNRDASVGNGYCNELGPAAEQLCPQLGQLKVLVADAGYPEVCMSGSGSTLFVGLDTLSEAERCQQHLLFAMQATVHRNVVCVVTSSGPAIDGDQPISQIPTTVLSRPQSDDG